MGAGLSFQCGQCGDSPLCDGKETLFFDMNYPGGPVCNWPQLVQCDGNKEIIQLQYLYCQAKVKIQRKVKSHSRSKVIGHWT